MKVNYKINTVINIHNIKMSYKMLTWILQMKLKRITEITVISRKMSAGIVEKNYRTIIEKKYS